MGDKDLILKQSAKTKATQATTDKASPLTGKAVSDSPLTLIKGGDPIIGTRIKTRVGKGTGRSVYSEDVKIVQYYLYKTGYLGPDEVDGKMGPRTQGVIDLWIFTNELEGKIKAGTFKNGIDPTDGSFDLLLSQVQQSEKRKQDDIAKAEYDKSVEGRIKRALTESKGNEKRFALACVDIFLQELPSYHFEPFFKHIKADEFIEDLKKTIMDPDIIDQGPNSLCGPAMMTRTLGEFDPLGYAMIALQLYYFGEANYKDVHLKAPKALGEAINPFYKTTTQTTDATGKVTTTKEWKRILSPVNFVMLATIRNHGNAVNEYIPGEHNQTEDNFSELEGIEGFTWPSEPYTFYQQLGFNVKLYKGLIDYYSSEINPPSTLENIGELLKRTTITIPTGVDIQAVSDTLDEWVKIVSAGGNVDMLIHTGVMYRNSDSYYIPNHYVSFNDYYVDPGDGKIYIQYWNWGRYAWYQTDFQHIAAAISRVYVVKK